MEIHRDPFQIGARMRTIAITHPDSAPMGPGYYGAKANR
jgi:hypothetical protein